MKTKTVTYRGIAMIEGWPARIRKAQKKLAYVRGDIEKPRVRYGDESTDWKADKVPCHDCKVIKGELHVPGCDVEACPACGGQLLSCECDWAEGKLGKPKKVARPFSKRELEIVAARRLFKWRHVGFKKNGNAIFEVTNGSSIRLPYLSVGIQDRGRTKLVGGAWLNVSGIAPGKTGRVDHACYKEQGLGPKEMEAFEEAEPTPETRNRYWEFQRMPKE